MCLVHVWCCLSLDDAIADCCNGWWWGLGPEGPNPLFLQYISVLCHANASLIALQCLHVYLFLIPTWRPIVCTPVPCSHPHLLHPHVDSCPSYRCLLDHILITSLCLRPCSSILYK